MGPPSYMRSVVDRNVVMRRMTVHPSLCFSAKAVRGWTFSVNFITYRVKEMAAS